MEFPPVSKKKCYAMLCKDACCQKDPESMEYNRKSKHTNYENLVIKK